MNAVHIYGETARRYQSDVAACPAWRTQVVGPPPAARDREDDHASRAFDDEEIAAPDYPRDDVEIEDQASRAARRPRTPMARSILLVQGKPQLRRM